MFWGGSPKILDWDYKIECSTEHRTKFRANWPTKLGDYARKEKKKTTAKHKSFRKISFLGRLIKATYGSSHHSVHPVRSKDGNTLIKDQQGIMARWAEHLSELLNHISSTDPTYSDLLPQLLTMRDLDHMPSFNEVCSAIKGLNKAAGSDGVSAEVIKHGGYFLLR